jgi:hypothetical protein
MAYEHAAVVKAIEGDASGQSWRFQSGVTIGRGAENRLSFPDDHALSEQHLALVLANGRWYCLRTHDEACATLDEAAITAPQTLVRSGAILRCGRQALQIVYREPGADFEGSLAQDVITSTMESGATDVRQALDIVFQARIATKE